MTAARDADTERTELVTRGGLYRALWIQGVGVVAILTALRFEPIGITDAVLRTTMQRYC